MSAKDRLHRLDQILLGRLGVLRVMTWIRRHAAASLLVLAGLLASALLVGTVIPLLGTLLTLTYVVGLVVLSLAVTDDMNDRGRRGGLWGLVVLLTGGLAAALWALDINEPTG